MVVISLLILIHYNITIFPLHGYITFFVPSPLLKNIPDRQHWIDIITRYHFPMQLFVSTRRKIVFCIGFNVHFNTYSGHIRTVPACNIGHDNHFIVLSYWHRRHSQIISRPVTVFWQRVNQFLCIALCIWAISIMLFVDDNLFEIISCLIFPFSSISLTYIIFESI